VLAGHGAAFGSGEMQHVTLFGEHLCTSVFNAGSASIAAFHRARVLLPGVREKLSAAVEALAQA